MVGMKTFAELEADFDVWVAALPACESCAADGEVCFDVLSAEQNAEYSQRLADMLQAAKRAGLIGRGMRK